jgi:riboflavin synthase
MFTGLVEETAEVLSVAPTPEGGVRLQLGNAHLSSELKLGDSLAVNGCCLTVAHLAPPVISFDLLGETLARTNLGDLRPGDKTNLERSVRADSRMGGHFVQGHIDCTSPILGLETQGADLRLQIALPPNAARYLILKGSVAVDGISLTVAEVRPDSFVAWIIPHTRKVTNLGSRKVGDRVNLEFDMLAKYVEKMLEPLPESARLQAKALNAPRPPHA